MLAQQFPLGHGEGVSLNIEVVDLADAIGLLRDNVQLAGPVASGAHCDSLYRLRGVASGSGAIPPAASLDQLVYIVPNVLGAGLPFQLVGYRGNVLHHGLAHRA